MKKRYITQEEINSACLDIVRQMYADNWRPDYIVGITRGGLWPAVMISHYTGIKMHTLDVRLRDTLGTPPESNCWMAEDALGYNDPPKTGITGARWDIGLRDKILIVDDINDTGATFNWIKQDWQNSCLPSEDTWNTVWGNNVRFASLMDNAGSDFKVDYTSIEIDKEQNPEWIVFPYEQWW